MDTPIDYLMFKLSVLKRFGIIPLVTIIALLLKQKGFALGFFVGGSIALAIFLLLYKYILSARRFLPTQRKRFLIPRALLVYLIMGLTLLIAIKKGLLVFFGAALGLFFLKVVMFMEIFKENKCQAAS